jgi:hypothetical protein
MKPCSKFYFLSANIRPPKKGRNMQKITINKQFLPYSRGAISRDKVFSSTISVIVFNKNVIELLGDMDSNSKKISEKTLSKTIDKKSSSENPVEFPRSL